MFLKKFTTILMASSLAACATTRNAAAPETASPLPAKDVQRPNILFIMTDDHALQALSAYGSAISRLAPTPNLDRIAQNGALFENSFVTNSLCGPSRAAMLTGKFGNENGFNQNGDQFDNEQPTWPRALKEAGYQTAIVGKWHLGHDPKGMKFDYWKVLRDQGEYYNPDFVTPDGDVREEGYATDLITDMGIAWLDHGRDPSKPFALMVHHKAPHRNWMPAPRHLTKYLGTEFPVPDNFFDEYDGRDAAALQAMNVHRNMYEGHDLKMTTEVGSTDLRYNRWPGAFDRMTPGQRKAFMQALQKSNDAMNARQMTQHEIALWKYQRYLQQYLATLASVDESVGRLLDYLDRHGLTNNTIVVYTSDQGFYLGEHGWFDKRFMYEESFRTPLLVQYPGHIKPGTRIEELVQNIDYAPTFLDYAGVDIPEAIQGRSLKPLLEDDRTADWRDSLYYHYYEYPDFHRVAPHCGVRDERYKLIHFYGPIDSWELYDEQSDPQEMNNLANDTSQAPRVASMKRELIRLQAIYRDDTCG